MRSSPLLLKEYFTTSLSFSATPGFESNIPDVRVISPKDLKVEVLEGQQEDNPLQRSCQLIVELNDTTGSKFPYNFSIVLVGFFEVIPEWPPDRVDQLFSANAPAVLYSAAREALAAATGRGPYPEILLPSVTFVQPPDKKMEHNEKQLSFSDVEKLPEKSVSSPESISTKKTTRKTSRRQSKK
jgi:preprotein translocase subunit SecB